MPGPEHEVVGGTDDRVAVTAGGVHVSKWVAEGGSSVPIIKYELSSTREEDVRVAFTDRIPDSLGLDDFGFHDEYHGERWTHVDENEVRFETELGAGETLTTVYGVRRDAITDPSAFLGRPEVSISASSSTTTDAPEPDDEATRAESDASEEGVPTLSLPDPDPEDEESVASISLEDDAREDDGADDDAEGTDAGIAAPEGAPDVEPLDDGSDADGDERSAFRDDSDQRGEELVERLVAALESDDLDPETRAALGRELNLQLSASSSQFVEHLQSRMKKKRGQLEGDIEAVEDSIAELYGVKADESTVASIRSEMADRETVEAVSADVAALAEEKADADALDSVRDDLATVESDAATETALESTENALEDRIGSVDDALEELGERSATNEDLADVASDVDSLRSDLDALRSDLDALRSDHESLADDAARRSDVAELESDLDAIEQSLAETIADRADELDDRVDDEVDALEAELSELEDRTATVAALEATDADVAATDERVDDLETESATEAELERVESELERVESDIEDRYVTEATISDAIEARLERSLLARTLLVGAGGSAGAGVALVATGLTAGVALVVLGVAALAYWWWLNVAELDPAVDHTVTDTSTTAGESTAGKD